jgi:small subunit ribosomal protein S19e
MTTVYDVEPNALIGAVAKDLKGKVKAPDWSQFVKTGVAKERPPQDPEWWYTREASILRKIYVKGPIGISRLRNEYRAKKNRGVRPEKSFRASGKVTRLAVQQLEEQGFVKTTKSNDGREITPKGMKYLDNIAHQVKIKS